MKKNLPLKKTMPFSIAFSTSLSGHYQVSYWYSFCYTYSVVYPSHTCDNEYLLLFLDCLLFSALLVPVCLPLNFFLSCGLPPFFCRILILYYILKNFSNSSAVIFSFCIRTFAISSSLSLFSARIVCAFR